MTAPVAIVSGSGLDLSAVLDAVHKVVSFEEAGVLVGGPLAGHQRAFIHGVCGGRPVILQGGRLHCYEGLYAPAAAFPADVLAREGVETIVFTNAAGGLHPEMQPGALLAANSIVPFLPPQGSRWWDEAPSFLAPDFVVPGCDFEGTYAWVLGPNYETRAEIGALHTLGAAAVGMSTGPEMARCSALGIRCAAVSCITNNCCTPMVLTHEHVVEVSRAASDRIAALLRRLFEDVL